MSRAATAITRATGRYPQLVRPPYGAHNERVRAAIKAPVVMWSVDTRDWADRDARVVTSRVLANVRPGSIVLMHDIHRSTADAAPAIITGLRKKGYRLVTVSELYGGAKLTPARSTTSADRPASPRLRNPAHPKLWANNSLGAPARSAQARAASYDGDQVRGRCERQDRRTGMVAGKSGTGTGRRVGVRRGFAA